MVNIGFLFQKSIETVKNYGVGTFFKKTAWYIIQRIQLTETDSKDFPSKVYKDVLFINGCYLPHPARYRVTHQREQLTAYNISCSEVLYENITLELIKHYRVFIFFRCPYTDTIGDFIRVAKEHHKTVLYDIDDLVIDKKYTSQVKYIQEMPRQDREIYENGVDRMHRTLLLCDGAITTTERLATELKNYVPEVFINRNVASEEMLQLSQQEIYNRDVLPYEPTANLKKKNRIRQKEALSRIASKKVRIGYFSGSITHNSDIEMILPALRFVLENYKNVELHFVGEMDVPAELQAFQDRIVAMKFVSWQKLPALIAAVDINIAPLEDTIFNEAKSENKWVEAALVKVPTVASRVGAFTRMIENGKTGFLCVDNDDWKHNLSVLIEDKALRKTIAESAYQFAIKNACTIETGYSLAKYIKSKMNPNLFMVLPSTEISGGVFVALQHCIMLSKSGVDVTLINDDVEQTDIAFEGQELFVLSRAKNKFHGKIDKAVATLWSTTSFINLYPNIEKRFYLVQGYEVDFSKPGSHLRIVANQSYMSLVPAQYITISKWCQKWLKEKYDKEARYARNGIELKDFPVRERSFSGKVRILVEGNSDDFYKNIDECFHIIERLDKEKYEIWYMSYLGKPKKWYYVDKFLHKIPHSEVGKIYEQCDILLKSSLLESFSYPPLEMMATGGFCVVAPNGGNSEFLIDGKNCLLYEQGNLDSAIYAIERICSDESLRNSLYKNGLETARGRAWDELTAEILALYD